MKYNIGDIPDWVGNAIVGIGVSLIGLACMWGSLKSEVSAQVTAQATDASDIKQLILGQARVEATVNLLVKDQELLHQDVLSLVNANGRRGN